MIKNKFTGKPSLTKYFACETVRMLEARERSKESRDPQIQWIVAAARGISHGGVAKFYV